MDSAYVRLARELREGILRQDFPEGVRLPTESELASTHRVSRQTVRRAFQDLVAEGLVHRVPGRGTFASRPDGRYLRQFGSIEDLMALSVDTDMRLVSPLRPRIDVDAAGRLRLESDRVFELSFLRLHATVPFCLTTVFLPPEVGRLLESAPELTEPEASSRATIIGLLEGRLPDPIAEAEQSVTVALAGSAVAEQLGCEVERPLLRIDRLYLASSGKPVELAVSHFLPEHYSYRVRLRRHPS
ncbi:GntR family transcriptional regulator [Amycolatopsis sp.]|uniref:GntR family transcriptional regulator n=1 Tax=Amycolatopsis sp. TaxID=37632 RepID=UPI002D0D3FA5|nr:GntR family transcriptional regulator [Amycolatopsis sp.]HVV09451.1 GntR family transcriptional regulator [Amycolatopsis sp.]